MPTILCHCTPPKSTEVVADALDQYGGYLPAVSYRCQQYHPEFNKNRSCGFKRTDSLGLPAVADRAEAVERAAETIVGEE